MCWRSARPANGRQSGIVGVRITLNPDCQGRNCKYDTGRSLHDDARGGAAGRGFARDLLPDTSGDVAEGLRIGRIRLRHDDRPALVRGLADGEVDRHLAEKIGAEALGFAASAAMAEDVTSLAAMRA